MKIPTVYFYSYHCRMWYNLYLYFFLMCQQCETILVFVTAHAHFPAIHVYLYTTLTVYTWSLSPANVVVHRHIYLIYFFYRFWMSQMQLQLVRQILILTHDLLKKPLFVMQKIWIIRLGTWFVWCLKWLFHFPKLSQ